MFTVRIIPIVRGPAVEELTYFSALEYPVGTVLEVPVRGREQRGVVVAVESVSTSKAVLRSSSFALRKIKRQTPQTLLLPEFVRAVEKTASFHCVGTSAVLSAYVPKVLFSQESVPLLPLSGPRPHLRGFVVPKVYQGLYEHRVEFYRSSIREAFAAKGSTLLVCATVAGAERLYTELCTGIDQYVTLLHSKLTPKQQEVALKRVLDEHHPVVLVCTPGFMAVPRHDLLTIIVDQEANPLYRRHQRPCVDARILAHNLAAELGGQLFLADLPLQIESVYRKELGEYEEIVTGNHRLHFKTGVQIVSLQGQGRKPKEPFFTLGATLGTRMREVLQNNGRIMLYVARRGLAPVTVCADCGTTVTCRECHASVVLHKGREENHFVCHSCGAMRHARERCVTCNSWRLETLGVGIELVAEEVQRRIPDIQTFILSSDTANTHKKVKTMVEEFYATKQSIMVATELAIPYLHKHVPLVGVVSLDSLLSLPHWNVYERLTSTLTRLRELAGEELLIQTRHPDEAIFEKILAGNFSGYYRYEMRARKALGYPPYSVLVKVSATGTEAEVRMRMQEAQEKLKPADLIIAPQVLHVASGKYLLHGFLRIAREEWSIAPVRDVLRSLPMHYTVEINPGSIL